MRIALVRPTIGAKDNRPYRTRRMLEPLALAVLAGLTPPGFELRCFDERLEEVPTGERFDLAAITAESFTARRAYQLARAFRAHGTPVVLGGFHPTLMPDEAAAFANAVALGEPEVVWPQVLADLRAGALRPRYEAPPRGPVFSTRVDRSIYRDKAYLPAVVVEFTRGCRYACDYCSVQSFFRHGMGRRPVADVVEEIRRAGRKTVVFADDNITADRTAARELFAALQPLGVRWCSQASIEIARDPGVVDAMADSGCVGLLVGLESLSAANLAQMKKTWVGSPDGYARALAALRQRGIMILGAFIFGCDQDTTEVFDRTVDFALEQKLGSAAFSILQPYPGTGLHRSLAAQQRLIYPAWWTDPRYRWDKAAFRPARMSAEELAQGVHHARARFASVRSILQRATDFQANLCDPVHALVYFTTNLVSREDIRRKEGLMLGYDEALEAAATT